MDFSSLIKKLTGKHWGVHPADHKRPAADQPVHAVPLPQRLHLMLSQHVGAAARPVVLVGQKVRKGELIAAAQGNISAPLHAPTSGVISAIGEITAPHASGLPAMAITLTVDGDDRWIEPDNLPADPYALAAADVAARVAAAGVVGMGGATFPSSVKLNLGRRSDIDTLIINGSECEPYLSCDDRLMRDKAAEIVSGIRLMLVAVRKGEAGRLHMHGFAECQGLTAAQRREWREMLEDLWRRRIPGSNEFEPLGTMNVDRIDMKKLLGKSGQGEYGTVGYLYGHKERLWVETANLRPAIEQAPNDGRWSRKQLRAACGEKQNDAQWWEQRFPGWKMEKCIVLEPGGLHESPKREGTGWERLEPQCYVILRRREAAILRT